MVLITVVDSIYNRGFDKKSDKKLEACAIIEYDCDLCCYVTV